MKAGQVLQKNIVFKELIFVLFFSHFLFSLAHIYDLKQAILGP